MPDFFRLSVEESLKQLNSIPDQGLSEAEVTRRQQEFGKNALPRGEGTNWVQLVVSQFTDLMVLILIAAALISLFLGEVTDVIVILVIVILNAALGVYQEYRAEQALAALSALQVPLVRVRRDGKVHQISAEELVPGDIVLLDEGDRIPADGRLIVSNNLQVEEAALTGESEPVNKKTEAISEDGNVALGDRINVVYMGTSVNYGRGEMVVTDTGLETELGNIAAMLLQVETGQTPLQRRLAQLGTTLASGAGIVVVIVFIVGWLVRGIPAQEMFLVAISLAVAAVPEGLPALVTISLSLGAARMVRRNALIRRLPAVETLGSVTVICSDKTGTLTKNEMTATQLILPGHDVVNVSGVGYTPRGEFVEVDGDPVDPRQDQQVGRFLRAMALSTNAYLENDAPDHYNIVGDTTEGALVVAAQKVGWTREALEEEMPRVGELPFSSERKAMTTIHQVKGEEARSIIPEHDFLSITKGAPDKLIEWASREYTANGPVALSEDRRDLWQKEVNEMASRGLRVLAIAYRPWENKPQDVTPEIERQLTLLGLVGIADPARPEARTAVHTAREAGIRPVMITGDHALTAESIARNLGIIDEGARAITGSQLDEMSEAEFSEAVRSTSAFARVSPEHKLRIVRELKAQGQVVAMTGDGVNDAPALKQADIGVAMGITGTDVSKGASEMVLTDDNFASIVAAVEEGRTIYDNIRKFIKYLLSSNVGEILVMFVALLVGLKIPLLAIQILWINLVTDGLPAIALGFSEPEPGVMKRKPRPVSESIFAGGVGTHIIWVGLLIAALTLGGFIYGFTSYGMNPFSDTLDLENFSRAEILELVPDEELVPETWDELTPAQRVEILQPEEGGVLEENAGEEGILDYAEHVPRTIAFTILAFTQMFEVMAIHAGDRASFFKSGFGTNQLLFWAVISTFVLQLIVVYVPFFQDIFRTAPLTLGELALTAVLGSFVLIGVEIEKLISRRSHQQVLAD
ncbi:MAG: calcium-transporting P-type ATPase, PMR1-type [Anaerolineae bacterium]